jgi:hypothetical protein
MEKNMNQIPKNWNIVILGFWNKAILTPNFISEKIFRNQPGTIYDIDVPIDLLGPPRVKYENFVVVVESNQLIIETTNCTVENLKKAMDYAKNAIIELPVTPFIAAGFNIRYEFDDIDPRVLSKITESKIDDVLSISDYEIINKIIKRTLKYKDGTINVYINYLNNKKLELQINFNLISNKEEQLKEWISINESELNSEIEKINKIFLESSYA